MVYNLLSCGGFTEGVGGWIASSGCLKARLGLVLLFFCTALIRRWGAEELGIEFSFLFSLIGGLLPYLIVITIIGSFKVALIIGLLGMLIGGYGGGVAFGGSDGGYE